MTEFHDAESATQKKRIRGARDPWQTDRMDAVGWAAIFTWGALVLVATYTSFSEDYSWWEGWGVFFVGAGVIVLVETLARLAMPEYRWKWWWSLLWGTAFLSFGLSALYGEAWLALALVAFAIVILKGAFSRTD